MTRKMMLIAGVACLAVTAPAAADPKGDRGARAEQPQRAERQKAQRAERPQRVERQQERAERRETRRVERPQRAERQQVRQVERVRHVERREVRRAERPMRIERKQARQAERIQRAERRELRRSDRINRVERQQPRQAELSVQRQIRPDARAERRELKRADRDERRILRQAQRAERQRTLFAREDGDREMRPMRAVRQQQPRISIGDRLAATALAPVPMIYANRYADTPDSYYRYDDDYGTIYRVDRDDHFVTALYPMFGGYSVGDPWPSMYRSSYVPYGYQGYYYDTPDYYYRNDGNAIYRIDAGTQLISGIVALLLGQSLGVGQLLPTSLNTYNVPLAYRGSYYDRDDSWYRYGDGYIYQVDPYSRRIEERYPLYADDYYVGQRWPVAYPDYNVPYGYRDVYYDTPQHHYRYANNGIYQVDPTTQMITALVALLSGQQFGIGQAMPAGYSAYNVPLAYRDRYYDTNRDWYRYADGYVYQVDPRSGLIEEAYPVYA